MFFIHNYPVLDAHEIEEINNTILESMEFTQEVTVTYFEDGAFKPCMGHIHFVDHLNKHIRVVDKFEEIHRIKFEDIINVQIIYQPHMLCRAVFSWSEYLAVFYIMQLLYFVYVILYSTVMYHMYSSSFSFLKKLGLIDSLINMFPLNNWNIIDN
ncbi:YolD-like family protein [Bacillus sp. SCS-151]|uniref:YolD-like family protein n=1 Tax=Nanhaiella sioensis TaxID=3115293 RepID=UPI00397A5544